MYITLNYIDAKYFIAKHTREAGQHFLNSFSKRDNYLRKS